ncbi:MAG: DUF362 domain-containing protein [Dehalococcoidia bacterium]|nr:DUF362 domain-containing protein [Dehalococcoidia bacterium]
MSQVLFFDYSKGRNPLGGVHALLDKSGFAAMIPSGGSVAIKLHMGELGNIRYVRPVFVRKIVDIVRDRGGRPFLFETVASYPGERDTKQKYLNTAIKNGFAEATVGARIVITDDEDKQEIITISNRINGCELERAKVPSLLLESPCIVVASHIKGHDLTGFGGALKNVGMGCVSSETKRAQHFVNMPQFNSSDCDGCGKCIESCPTDAIKLVNETVEREVSECISCGTCLFKCPSHCWVWPAGSKEKLQVYLAHVASAILSEYKGRIGFINFVQDVVPHCDCAAPSGQPVVQDVGIVFSLDPVAADKASLDLVDRAPIIPGSISVTPPDLLGKMHQTDSLVQLITAEKLGVGTLKYDMVTI